MENQLFFQPVAAVSQRGDDKTRGVPEVLIAVGQTSINHFGLKMLFLRDGDNDPYLKPTHTHTIALGKYYQ